jgi:type IV secretory pathway component VirB8
MKRKFLQLSAFLLFFAAACNNNDNQPAVPSSENDIDAARNFIRTALDGNYRDARKFIVADSINLQYIDAFERNYNERMDPEDKREYRQSSININSVQQLNDSVTIVNYSNSYKKNLDSLKVIRVNQQWLIDLKYSFENKSAENK